MFEITTLLIILFQIYMAFTVIVLLLDNREPAETFAWIFIFILMPGVGFIVYLFAGRNWRNAGKRRRNLPQYLAKNLFSVFKPLEDAQEEKMAIVEDELSSYQDDLIRLLYNNSHSLMTTRNRVKFFHSGKEKFEALIRDIEEAKDYIHMEYFIWTSHDPLGKRLKELLIRKAGEGVEIRILFDFSGCFFKLNYFYVRSLRKAGIKIFPFFNYLSPFKLHTFNYRNHRKIAVIDGRIAYTGGMNIGQEYIDGGQKYESWRDTHMRVEGESVAVLQAIFAIDWYNTTEEENVFKGKYYPSVLCNQNDYDYIPMQFPTSGFDSKWPSILHLYFSIITMAQKNIYITSPYFIPEPSLLMALKTAAMRGIEVIVLLTGVPDKKLPYWAAFSYFEELLQAGVRVFHYQKGFLHAKIISSDENVCTIGTANFDIRSLKLNYEVNALIYDEIFTKEIDQQFYKDLEASKEMSLADFKQVSVLVKLRNSLIRLLSPLL
ncbi:MAG: cardiolipin synthase [Candidatus Omnitrophica bacterium]|nr:cardiolipin synthase [Candidatus Omnitrophota bacterium]